MSSKASTWRFPSDRQRRPHGHRRHAATEQVLQELEQLVLTNPGERLFLPDFGGGASRLLFEAADANTTSIAQATLDAGDPDLAGRPRQSAERDVSRNGIGDQHHHSPTRSPEPRRRSQAVFQRSSP